MKRSSHFHNWPAIYELWEAGVPVAEIAKRCGASVESLRSQVARRRKMGEFWPIHPGFANKRKPGQPIKEQAPYWSVVRKLWSENVPVREIAKAVNRSPSTIVGGIHYRRRAGEAWPLRPQNDVKATRRSRTSIKPA